jgi:riboflavin kinase / FMN adenylyltransferase
VTEVTTTLDALVAAPSVVTIGNFDGVHRGHRVLLRRAVDTAADRGLRAVAMTFDPHPAAVLRPGSEPPRLQSLDDRIASLADTGVDLVAIVPFDHALAALSPQEFVAQVLVGGVGVERIVVGTNFRFGNRAAGDVVTLVEQGEEHGFSVEAVTLHELEGVPLSSSAIRERLVAGELAWPTAALGRPFSVQGEVVTGEGRGRTIGVPTANLDVPAGLLVPGNGVYAGHATDGERTWPAVTNVGVRPTFDGANRSVEVHLLDTEVDLYGRAVRFTFEHRLRGEQRFDGPDALVAQIRRDIAAARDHLDVG